MEEAQEGDKDDLENMPCELQRLSSLIGAQQAVRARAEAKVVAWEGKVEQLRAGGGG